jgi:hypothetical protein
MDAGRTPEEIAGCDAVQILKVMAWKCRQTEQAEKPKPKLLRDILKH